VYVLFKYILFFLPYILKFSCSQLLSIPRGIKATVYSPQIVQVISNRSIPASCTQLTFGTLFSDPIILPPSLTHVTFKATFNHPVDTLPHTLRHITFGSAFDQPVDNIPPCLTHLSLGYFFSQPLDNLPAAYPSHNFRTSWHPN
jgi:hypothetical protein